MSDYLWDKTGEPDKEIKRLEEMLRPLRYQYQSLELPAHAKPRRRTSIFLPLAAAAILVLSALAGIWTHFLRPNAHKAQPQAHRNLASPERGEGQESNSNTLRETFAQNAMPVAPPNLNSSLSHHRQSKISRRFCCEARHESPILRAKHDNKMRRQTLAADDAQRLRLREARAGEIAKERLMFALNITSHKLNIAQRKIKATMTQSPAANDENR